MATASDVEDLASIFTSEAAYADEEHWHSVATRVRQQHPVHLVARPGWPTVWAIMKHADVMAVERRHDIFLNTEWVLYQPAATMAALKQNDLVPRTIIQMDDPEHRQYRSLTVDRFTAASLRRHMQERLDALSKEIVDRMEESGGECDFVTDFANLYPLRVILGMLGVPREQEAAVLDITRQNMSTTDPEYAKSGDPAADFVDSLDRMIDHLGGLTELRRAHPTDDLASVIANGTIDGELLGSAEANFYYAILATAGHDTVAATLAGGLEVLIRHPDAREELAEHPELIPNAVEEILRWVSPAKGFMRLATEDFELQGKTVKAGERVLLSYPSANRDEDVFADPFTFDIHRTNANRNIAFGFGKHFCLGAQLARMELRSFFTALVPRLADIELAGTVERSHSTVVSGVKHLPVSYRMRAA